MKLVGDIAGGAGDLGAVTWARRVAAGPGGIGLRAGFRGGEEALHGGGFMDDGGPDEVLVEHHGGEVLVRAPAVVVGLPAVRERLAPTSSGTDSA
ncbi:hypothetical protein SMICM17S_01850 [Streptomyces microflavus]